MPIIVKNEVVQDIKALAQPEKKIEKIEKKISLADNAFIAERFSRKKPIEEKTEKKISIADERIVSERFGRKKLVETEKNIVVEHTTQEQKTLNRKFVIHKKELKGVASAENSLLVNGKQKNIGRKSHYLLDMLTLDDE